MDHRRYNPKTVTGEWGILDKPSKPVNPLVYEWGATTIEEWYTLQQLSQAELEAALWDKNPDLWITTTSNFYQVSCTIGDVTSRGEDLEEEEEGILFGEVSCPEPRSLWSRLWAR